MNTHTMRHTCLRALTTLAACCALDATAAVVTMNGTCDFACDQLGLAPGGTVSARFDLDVAGVASIDVGKASVASFWVDFGNIAFDNTDLSNWDFRMSTDASGNVTGLQLLASFGSSFDALGDSLDLRESQWWTSHNAVCSDGVVGTACDFSVASAFGALGSYEHGTSAVTIAADAQNVPEPTSLALAGVALCGLFGARKRRHRSGPTRPARSAVIRR